MCKLTDPKHSDITRSILQNLIYYYPDWYVSKEGDVEFEAVEWLAGRQGGANTSADYGTGKYGARIHAIDDDTTILTLKPAGVSEDDTNRVIDFEVTDTGYNLRLGSATINSIEDNDYDFEFSTANRLLLQGDKGITLSGGTNNSNPRITIDDNRIDMYDETNPNGHITTNWTATTITRTFGSAITETYDRSGNGTYSFICQGDIINIEAQEQVNIKKNLNVQGEITASKVWNAVYNGFGEIFRKDKNEEIEYGYIVYMGRDGLVHKVTESSNLDYVIGICSNTIGIGLGGKDIPEDEQVEVEMLGQIWVNTDEEIHKGELVKALANGKVGYTNKKEEKFAIAMTDTIDGKVRVVYGGAK